MSKKKLSTFGERIKRLREEKGLPQRKVAALLDIDTSLLAKYEKDTRQPSKELIMKIADLFAVNGDELYTEALTDKIAYQIIEEEADSKLLRVAETKVEYIKTKNISKHG